MALHPSTSAHHWSALSGSMGETLPSLSLQHNCKELWHLLSLLENLGTREVQPCRQLITGVGNSQAEYPKSSFKDLLGPQHKTMQMARGHQSLILLFMPQKWGITWAHHPCDHTPKKKTLSFISQMDWKKNNHCILGNLISYWCGLSYSHT